MCKVCLSHGSSESQLLSLMILPSPGTLQSFALGWQKEKQRMVEANALLNHVRSVTCNGIHSSLARFSYVATIQFPQKRSWEMQMG